MVELVSLDLLERRVKTEKLETQDQLESLALPVLKAMWGRRVTLALLVHLDPQDREEYQGRMDLKATLDLLDSREIQDPLENLVSME